MKILLGQGISIFIILLALVALLLYALWGFPNEDAWWTLLEMTYAEIPFGAWIIIVLAFISFSFSLNTLQKVRDQEKKIEKGLRPLLEAETFVPVNKKQAYSKRLHVTTSQLEQLILTQRKTLQRITNQKAEDQDKLIQERIVQERQRLARELHDSVSQQLFAASMLLSAMVEIEEAQQGEAPKTLLQTEKIVQQAQLEMRALLLHLRPAALHNKTLRRRPRGIAYRTSRKSIIYNSLSIRRCSVIKRGGRSFIPNRTRNLIQYTASCKSNGSRYFVC